jgi:ribosomal protein S12 methylthiotransferase accessory factor
LDRQTALWGAVGEAVERCLGHLIGNDRITIARERDLEGCVAAPSDFILFDEGQYADPGFRFRRYDPDQPISWVAGRDLATGALTWVPAAFAVMGHLPANEHDLLDLAYSSGMAAGPNEEAAILSALLEYVERDGVMTFWQGKIPPPEIDLSTIRTSAADPYQSLAANPLVTIRAFDITTDLGIPSILTVIRPKHRGGVALGAAARPTQRMALEKSLVEAYHTFNWVIDLERGGYDPPTLEGIKEFRHHVDYWRRPEAAPVLDRYLAQAVPASLPDMERDERSVADRLADMVRKIGTSGYRAIHIPFDFDLLQDAGLSIARVIVPGLQTITCGVGQEHRDMRRINRVRRARGLAALDQPELYPHPFP